MPSFILLKALRGKYQALCDTDDELNNLFNSAINCSKLFYMKTIDLVENKSEVSEDKYEENFERIAQPLGQQLINLLTNIKYRIRIVRLRNSRPDNMHKKYISYYLYNFAALLRGPMTHLTYRITLLTSSNQNIVKKSYYAAILGTIFTFWIFNYAFLNNISPISSAFLNVISGIAVVLLAIVSYPIGDFGKKDISGRNIVAYRYKVLLNNRKKNSKLLNIFTLQHGQNVNVAASSSGMIQK